ncbi:MAG: aromatic-ring-hydroxylating dioxygenase subunit beta [Acidimicrobiales bacterium]
MSDLPAPRPGGLAPPPPPLLQADVEHFLYHDAELLDTWRLRDWFERFSLDCRYHIPTTDRPDGDPTTDLSFVWDDWFLLSQRIESILDGTAWAESPRSTTHRMVANVRARELPDGSVEAKANVTVHRSAGSRLDVYPAFLTLVLLPTVDGGFEIRHRKAVLALHELRPHGRLSILL